MVYPQPELLTNIDIKFTKKGVPKRKYEEFVSSHAAFFFYFSCGLVYFVVNNPFPEL
jgi:hypothetical protein